MCLQAIPLKHVARVYRTSTVCRGISNWRIGDKFQIAGYVCQHISCGTVRFNDFVTLPETNSSPLKMDGWNTTFLLGTPIFRCYVSFRECSFFTGSWGSLWVKLHEPPIYLGLSLLVVLRLSYESP